MTTMTARSTAVSIDGESFRINGRYTYPGRYWKGHRIEGLLLNSRMVQAVFDDANPETAAQWAYPDTGTWDADRNTGEFIQNMGKWHSYGLNSITLNLQGGSPQGYSKEQPWVNSAILADGSLDPVHMGRMERVLDEADRLGMVVMLGIFYFGQDEMLADETAICTAVDNTVDWLFERGYRNVIIEVVNETHPNHYHHAIFKPERIHELIVRVKERTKNGERLLAGTSYAGNAVPSEQVVRVSDFLLIHGNGVHEPAGITGLVEKTRSVPGYRPMPVIINEDDHFDFDKADNNFIRSVASYVSWGYFDYRYEGEGFEEGYQSVPVEWSISSERKKGFFNLLREITGAGQGRGREL